MAICKIQIRPGVVVVRWCGGGGGVVWFFFQDNNTQGGIFPANSRTLFAGNFGQSDRKLKLNSAHLGCRDEAIINTTMYLT